MRSTTRQLATRCSWQSLFDCTSEFSVWAHSWWLFCSRAAITQRVLRIILIPFLFDAVECASDIFHSGPQVRVVVGVFANDELCDRCLVVSVHSDSAVFPQEKYLCSAHMTLHQPWFGFLLFPFFFCGGYSFFSGCLATALSGRRPVDSVLIEMWVLIFCLWGVLKLSSGRHLPVIFSSRRNNWHCCWWLRCCCCRGCGRSWRWCGCISNPDLWTPT